MDLNVAPSKLDAGDYKIEEIDNLDVKKFDNNASDTAFVVWLDADAKNVDINEETKNISIKFERVLTFTNTDSDTTTVKVVFDYSEISKFNITASLANIVKIADENAADSTEATLNFEANRKFADNINSLNIKEQKYTSAEKELLELKGYSLEEPVYSSDKYLINVQATSPLKAYKLNYSFVDNDLNENKNEDYRGKYYAVVLDLGVDTSTLEITLDDYNIIYESVEKFAINDTSIVVWVDAINGTYLTITDKATGYKVYVTIYTNDVEYVPATDDATEDGNALTNPVVSKAYNYSSDYELKDAVIVRDDKFVVNNAVDEFIVTDGKDVYTYYKEALFDKDSYIWNYIWYVTKKLDLKQVKNDIALPEYDSDQLYNLNSIKDVTFTKNTDDEGYTVNVVFNRTLDDYDRVPNYGRAYGLVIDLGINSYDISTLASSNYEIEEVDRYDANRHVIDSTEEDSNYIVIWLDADVTDTEDGRTITFINTIDESILPVTFKSTYEEDTTKVDYISVTNAKTASKENLTAEESFGGALTSNMEAVHASYKDEVIRVAYDKVLVAYENANIVSGYQGKYFGLLLDLGVDPTKLINADADREVIKAAGLNYQINPEDITDAAKFGGTGNEFIVWLDANDFEDGALTLKFATTTNKFETKEVMFQLIDAIEDLKLKSVRMANAVEIGKNTLNLKHAANQAAISVELVDRNIVFTKNDEAISYDNGHADAEWYAVLVDFGVNPQYLVANSTNYEIEAIDITDAARHGAKGTEFVMWLKADEASRDIKFTNNYNGQPCSFTVLSNNN